MEDRRLDEALTEDVERHYPYPLAVAFRRLGTDEYLEPGHQRLVGLLDVAEKTAYFLAYTLLLDAFDRVLDGTASRRFPALRGMLDRGATFGNLVGLIRQAVLAPESGGHLAEIRNAAGAETAQALNRLVEIRNSAVGHPARPPGPAEISRLCREAEAEVATVLGRLDVLRHFECLSVNRIEVLRKRRDTPLFKHSLSRVVGSNDSFRAVHESSDMFMDSYVTPPVLLLRRRGESLYLNLFPLVVLTHEGETGVPDVFFLSRADAAKRNYSYSGCNKGGKLRSAETSMAESVHAEMERLLGALCP